jgi:protein-S-isoprenylcysteine O-methyltransferase Ste14
VARRLVSVVGLLGAAVFLVLYGPELVPLHGPPPTVAWVRARIGDPGLVAVNVAAGLAFFLLLPYRRETERLWRSKGVFTAFVIALMTEMFGWPLLLWLLAPLVEMPSLGVLTHDALSHALPVAGTWLSLAGVLLVVLGWRRIHAAQGLVTDGIYARIRHPQYAGLLLFTLGWLIHWPTILTLLLWPVLAVAYARLAKREEEAMRARFGDAYAAYAAVTPRFVPRLRK